MRHPAPAPRQSYIPSGIPYTWLDWLISLALVSGGLWAYTSTLAPTVLDGDAALFQYTPYILGVTYPTGYPIYILLSKLWLSLFPFGEIAWRMNLFSAICGSLALPLIYGVARNILENRTAALISVLIYATMPTYWRWATEAKIYTLNILLYALVLWLATISLRIPLSSFSPLPGGIKGGLETLRRFIIKHRYKLGAICLGLQIGVHSTTALLLPGILLLFFLDLRRTSQVCHFFSYQTGKTILSHLPYFIIPASSYLYIPIRAEFILTRIGREVAIGHGLLADFYHSGLRGWIRYFTAADFTGGVVRNWGKVPEELYTVYLTVLLRQDLTIWGVLLGFTGLVTILLWPRLRQKAWPLILIYLVPIPFVLTYGQGEQSAFLLTSNLVFAIFTGAAIAGLTHVLQQGIGARGQGLGSLASRYNLVYIFTSLLGFVIILGLPYRQIQYNFNWLGHKWDRSSYTYWFDVLNHPLRQDAGILGTWGDLTSMWYMQHVEGYRPDLWGLYPPTEALAASWLAQDKPLYIGGPILDTWAPGFMERYQVLPWGRLVILADKEIDPNSLLPKFSHPQDIVFDQKLYLDSVDYKHEVDSDSPFYVSFAWQALTDLPRRTRYSVRIMDGDRIITQKDDNLRSGWFPLDHIPGGQPFVGTYRLDIPPGTHPGSYQLQLAIYSSIGAEWITDQGHPVLNLGEVSVKFTPAQTVASAHRFGNKISLDSYEFSVSRADQGKGFAVHFLWHTLQPLDQDYTLLVDMIDPDDRILRQWYIPTETSTWQKDQLVRQQVDVIIPAEAPTGEAGIRLQVSWLDAAGKPLPYRRWVLPAGDQLILGGIMVEPKPNRSFNRPTPETALTFNLDNKVALIGYQMPQTLSLSDQEQTTSLPLVLYWQGLDEMREVYNVFVHVLDQNQNIVAQHDGIPDNGKQGTTTWAKGEFITDTIKITLPSNLPPGEYTLITGIYLPPNGPRLPVLPATSDKPGDTPDNMPSDSIPLGKIRLE